MPRADSPVHIYVIAGPDDRRGTSQLSFSARRRNQRGLGKDPRPPGDGGPPHDLIPRRTCFVLASAVELRDRRRRSRRRGNARDCLRPVDLARFFQEGEAFVVPLGATRSSRPVAVLLADQDLRAQLAHGVWLQRGPRTWEQVADVQEECSREVASPPAATKLSTAVS